MTLSEPSPARRRRSAAARRRRRRPSAASPCCGPAAMAASRTRKRLRSAATRLSRVATRPGPAGGRRRTDDSGSAMVEFVGLSIVLLIPFLYFFLAVFSVQRSAFAVTQAAREAGRAYETAENEEQGLARARLAAQLAFRDQGIDAEPELRFAPEGADCGDANPGDGAASLEPGAVFVVCVRVVTSLPGFALLGPGFADITLNGQFTVVVDQFRTDRSGTQP